jgi:hypothetical protein
MLSEEGRGSDKVERGDVGPSGSCMVDRERGNMIDWWCIIDLH